MWITQIITYLQNHTDQEIQSLYQDTGKLNGHPFSISKSGRTFALSTIYNDVPVVSLFKINVIGNWVWTSNIYNADNQYGCGFGKRLCISDDGVAILVESDINAYVFDIGGFFSRCNHTTIPTEDDNGDRFVKYPSEGNLYTFKCSQGKWVCEISTLEYHMPCNSPGPIINPNLNSRQVVRLSDTQKEDLKVFSDKLYLSVEDMVDKFLNIINRT